MRDLGPFMIVSVALWRSLAWCFIAARTALGCDHIHLCARGFGFYLLPIDLAFVAAIVWHDRIEARGG